MPRKSQFTDEQIIRALREVDAGAKPADVCRRLGVTEKTFYRWKSKFGGLEVSDAKRLRSLEEENARLSAYAYLAWLGPAIIIGSIFGVTGISPTENQALRSKGDAYRAYQARVSRFIPLPPKRARIT